MNLELTVLARMAGQGASRIHLPHSPTSGVTGACVYSAVTSMLEIWTPDLMFVPSSLYPLNNSPASDQSFSMMIWWLSAFAFIVTFLLWSESLQDTQEWHLPLLFTSFFSPPTVSIFLTTRYHAPKIDESGIYLNRPTLFQWRHPASNPMGQDLLSNVARSSCYLKACCPYLAWVTQTKCTHRWQSGE